LPCKNDSWKNADMIILDISDFSMDASRWKKFP
jgi:hypothetical protein